MLNIKHGNNGQFIASGPAKGFLIKYKTINPEILVIAFLDLPRALPMLLNALVDENKHVVSMTKEKALGSSLDW